MHKSSFLNEIVSRGYLYQCTDIEALDTLLSESKITAYVGFDCTASSLHVGSLMQIMIMRMLQKYGHRPIILLGGATTRIGDPSDKTQLRKMLSLEEIESNKASISKIFYKLLGPSVIIVDNIDWLKEIQYLDFLRDFGKHFTINQMLTFDSVRLRLEREQPLTFLEFNYMLLQAYDFLELHKKYNCVLQFGGSEQWGNIVSGIGLVRKIEGASAFGITTPLITTASGAKMGKTAEGAVWLNSDLLSPYHYWQFWRNTADDDVVKFLKLYTDLPIRDIEELANLKGQDINKAKVILANEVTKICHGESAAASAEDTANVTFGDGMVGADIPVFEVTKSEIIQGIPMHKLFTLSKLCESSNEARNLIQGKGAKINNTTIENPNHIMGVDYFNTSIDKAIKNSIKISAGKKRHAVIIVKDL